MKQFPWSPAWSADPKDRLPVYHLRYRACRQLDRPASRRHLIQKQIREHLFFEMNHTRQHRILSSQDMRLFLYKQWDRTMEDPDILPHSLTSIKEVLWIPKVCRFHLPVKENHNTFRILMNISVYMNITLFDLHIHFFRNRIIIQAVFFRKIRLDLFPGFFLFIGIRSHILAFDFCLFFCWLSRQRYLIIRINSYCSSAPSHPEHSAQPFFDSSRSPPL